MTENNVVIAVFTDQLAAEAAVKKLADGGIDNKHLSVVGKGGGLSALGAALSAHAIRGERHQRTARL